MAVIFPDREPLDEVEALMGLEEPLYRGDHSAVYLDGQRFVLAGEPVLLIPAGLTDLPPPAGPVRSGTYSRELNRSTAPSMASSASHYQPRDFVASQEPSA